MRTLQSNCILVILILCYSTSTLATEVQALASIGKTWGFLKYYHPKVAKKTFNWDAVLVKALEDIERPFDQGDSRQVIEQLLQTAGPVSDCLQCTPDFPEELKVNVNWNWLEDTSFLSNSQSLRLKRIRDHFEPIQNAYNISMYEQRPGSNGLEFVLDDPYENVLDFDYTHRLLALFHYWNVIEYYYPYKYLSNPDWTQTLEKAIPIFLELENEHDFQLAMLWLSSRIKDSHARGGSSYIIDNFLGRLKAPFRLRLVEDSIVSIAYIFSDSLAAIEDIQLGDQLIELDGKPIWDHIIEKSKYSTGSNETTFYANCLKIVLRDTQENMTMLIKRNEKLLSKTIRKYPSKLLKYPVPKAPIWRQVSNSPNIIFCGVFSLPDVKEARKFIKSAKGAEGIILDLRPFTPMSREVFDEFIKSFCPPNAIDSKVFQPSEKYPGILESFGTQKVVSGDIEKKFQKTPIVYIVGENAISLDEYRIMKFQTNPNDYTIGSPTSGALANMGKIRMPGGLTANFTQKGMTYPDGSPVFGPGIKLDELIELTAEDIRSGTDPFLERAIEFLKEQL